MRLESGRIVIDDAYVCGFAERAGFLETLGALLRSVCDALAKADAGADALALVASGDEGPVARGLIARIDARVEAMRGATEDQLARFVEEVRSAVAGANAASANAANASGLADATAATASVLARIVDEREATHRMMERVCATLEEKERSNRRKGDDGEIGLVQVLEGTMTVRDGYTIERVGNLAHNCDILVRKQGRPDVRIECKAHGKDNGKPVAAREVVRFEEDLKLLRNHGIFVSLYAPITGKAQFELRLIESNRVAVYLSNNNFDAAMVRDLVLLIYEVDSLIHAEGIVISPERLCRIKAGLSDVSIKAAQIQAHLRAGLELVGSMCIESVARMLAEAGEGRIEEAPVGTGPGPSDTDPSAPSKRGRPRTKKN